MNAASRSTSARVVRGDVQQPAGASRVLPQQPARERVEVLVDVRLLRDTRPTAARGTRPSPAGSPTPSGTSDSMSFSVRYRYACSAMPMRGDRARVRRNRSSVGSTYGELSMSIQTKLSRSSARSTRRCRFRKHSSLSRSSPSCVGLTEICASQPGAPAPGRARRGSAASTSSASSTRVRFSPSLREDGADALRCCCAAARHRVLEPLAGHEGRHRSAHERRLASRARAATRWSTSRAEDACGRQTHSRVYSSPLIRPPSTCSARR